ncbi:MAG: hypothetical protein AMJ65_11695 [Phycisphaerae bacterium SG8_4]|nr:MAG: hypothetical protein AMJ65_11695 [Phycisphaerae bacterium SG8_4]
MYILFGYYNHILGKTHTREFTKNTACSLTTMNPIRHDNKKIKVAVWPAVASGCRSKENHSQRMNSLYDSLHDLRQKLRIAHIRHFTMQVIKSTILCHIHPTFMRILTTKYITWYADRLQDRVFQTG